MKQKKVGRPRKFTNRSRLLLQIEKDMLNRIDEHRTVSLTRTKIITDAIEIWLKLNA